MSNDDDDDDEVATVKLNLDVHICFNFWYISPLEKMSYIMFTFIILNFSLH